MATVNNCDIPEHLHYWIEKHVWARPEGDGTVTIGITDVAQHMASKIIAVTPKKVGRALGKGQSAATVESGKWVGPVATPVSGEIVAVNESLKADPGLVNTDPYGAGWIVRVKASNWDAEKGDLVTGPAGVVAYQQALDAQGITC